MCIAKLRETSSGAQLLYVKELLGQPKKGDFSFENSNKNKD